MIPLISIFIIVKKHAIYNGKCWFIHKKIWVKVYFSKQIIVTDLFRAFWSKLLGIGKILFDKLSIEIGIGTQVLLLLLTTYSRLTHDIIN